MVQNAKTNTTTKITTASQLPEHDLSFYGPPGKAWYLWLIVCVCVCPVVGGVHLQVEILPWATDNPPAGRESRTNPGQHPAPGKGREGKGGRTDAKNKKARDFCVHTSVNQGAATEHHCHIHPLRVFFCSATVGLASATHSRLLILYVLIHAIKDTCRDVHTFRTYVLNL